MIELHRHKESDFADQIEETLEDLVLAYKTVTHNDSDNESENPEISLPYLDENGTKITGKGEIKSFLRELSAELKEQRSISGDSCYIDPQAGEIC